MADLYLAKKTTLRPTTSAIYMLTADDVSRAEGTYRSTLDGRAVRLVRDGVTLRIDRGPALLAQSATRFLTANGEEWQLVDADHLRRRARYEVVEYERAPVANQSWSDLETTGGRLQK